jgi:hypothetical protein
MDEMGEYITGVLESLCDDDLIQILLYIDNDDLSGKLLVLMDKVYASRMNKLVNSGCDVGIRYSDEVKYLDKFYFYQNYYNRIVICIREELVSILFNNYELNKSMSKDTSRFIESSIINPSFACMYSL